MFAAYLLPTTFAPRGPVTLIAMLKMRFWGEKTTIVDFLNVFLGINSYLVLKTVLLL